MSCFDLDERPALQRRTHVRPPRVASHTPPRRRCPPRPAPAPRRARAPPRRAFAASGASVELTPSAAMTEALRAALGGVTPQTRFPLCLDERTDWWPFSTWVAEQPHQEVLEFDPHFLSDNGYCYAHSSFGHVRVAKPPRPERAAVAKLVVNALMGQLPPSLRLDDLVQPAPRGARVNLSVRPIHRTGADNTPWGTYFSRCPDAALVSTGADEHGLEAPPSLVVEVGLPGERPSCVRERADFWMGEDTTASAVVTVELDYVSGLLLAEVEMRLRSPGPGGAGDEFYARFVCGAPDGPDPWDVPVRLLVNSNATSKWGLTVKQDVGAALADVGQLLQPRAAAGG